MKEVISAQEVKKQINEKHIIDVREADEYQQEHIEGAVNIPLGRLIRDAGKGVVPKDKSVVVHCKSGVRGAIAMEFLKKKGYNNVQNLEGGFEAWKCL